MSFGANAANYARFQTRPLEAIEFLGLWDTVDAYGLPIAELGKGVDQWIGLCLGRR